MGLRNVTASLPLYVIHLSSSLEVSRASSPLDKNPRGGVIEELNGQLGGQNTAKKINKWNVNLIPIFHQWNLVTLSFEVKWHIQEVAVPDEKLTRLLECSGESDESGFYGSKWFNNKKSYCKPGICLKMRSLKLTRLPTWQRTHILF
jgi:hypothetical protein